MIGAMLGDLIGSYYEDHPIKTEDFPLFNVWSRFTDDSVLAAAIADALLTGRKDWPSWCYKRKCALMYAVYIKQYVRRYPGRGYGQQFERWAQAEDYQKQRSYGNGGAMRVIPIGYAYEKLEEVLREAEISCYYTHCHKEAIEGARAVAAAVYLARRGEDKEAIRHYLCDQLHYPVDFTLSSIRVDYVFNSRSSYSVPPAIVSFLESRDYEGCIRKAISIGGDSDTVACMAGGIAEAYYHQIPLHILKEGRKRLGSGLLQVADQFSKTYINNHLL